MDLRLKAKDLDHKAKAMAEDLGFKAKDVDFGLKDQGQGQELTSLHTGSN